MKNNEDIKPDRMMKVNAKTSYPIYDLSKHIGDERYNKLTEKVKEYYALSIQNCNSIGFKSLGLPKNKFKDFIILNMSFDKLNPETKKYILYHEEAHIQLRHKRSNIKEFQFVKEGEADMYAFKKLKIKTVSEAIKYITYMINSNLAYSNCEKILKCIFRMKELGMLK